MNANGHRTGDTKQNPALSGQWLVSPRHPSRSVRPETGSWNHRGVSGPARQASSRFQPRPMRRERKGAERRGEERRGEERRGEERREE